MLVYFGLLMILIAGLGNPVQTAVNSRLCTYTISPIIASAVSFAVGSAVLLVLTLATVHTVTVPHDIAASLPWWAWMGGAMGVVGLTGNILLFHKLGSIRTVLLPMTGQIIMSMIIDWFGLLGATPVPVSISGIIGLGLVLTGLAIYTGSRKKADIGSRSNLLWCMIAVLIGTIFAIQPAMNAVLATGISSAIHASFISFSSSLLILLIVIAVIPNIRHLVKDAFRVRRPWWTFTGGLFGANYVVMFAWFVPILGLGLVSLTGIFGMLTMSTLIDSRGWLGAKKTKISLGQLIGLLTVLAGIVIIKQF